MTQTVDATSTLLAQLDEHRAATGGARWRGSFADYLGLALADPKIARLAHARIHDMIVAAGVTPGDPAAGTPTTYAFFAEHLFGQERVVEQLVGYFRSAAARQETRKRILLLMGPVGGGKSTIVTLLKEGLARYTATPEGATYAIAGCPMHEEPLHLVPPHLRPAYQRDHGLYIEGDLCPVCAHWLAVDGPDHGSAAAPDHPWGRAFRAGDLAAVPVERIVFSEQRRVGIGTWQPQDPKGQDQSELVGSLNLATIGEVGSESDPRAYRFDGELNIANRGLVEMIEMLKADERFLYLLLTLTQEQRIKTARFSLIYADEVIIAHTNEHEYAAFAANRKNEAMQDRVIKQLVPYVLAVDAEVKVYQKLLPAMPTHVAPHALRTAATFAILTRLEDSKRAGIDRITKLKLYNGERLAGDAGAHTPQDVKELHEEAQREGMDGLSPRYAINQLAAAAVREGARCLSALDALRALRDGLDSNPALSKDQREQAKTHVATARQEYDDAAKRTVQRAFVYAYEDTAKALLSNYLEQITAFCAKTKVTDPVTGDPVEPEERLMRAIEEQVNISSSAAKGFREELLIHRGVLAARGQDFLVDSHERLKEAIEKKLFADMKDAVKIHASSRSPDPEQQERITGVVERLKEDHDYCDVCARTLLTYVGQLLQR